ncbi:MAG: tRNA (adenosine(37)-N6)-threonylcarbamoyltransferase complex dimerization subunit type 1 TsaB [Betaproteobacteria bacterium]
MRVLGIDTSTSTGGVALVSDDEVVAEYGALVTRTNSEGVAAVCGRLLAEAGWTVSQLDAVAVAIGPGSFTGVRIGVTMAKVLAYALDLPIGAVVTLDAIAANLPFSEALVCPLISARRDIVYTATYRVRGAYPERLSDYEAKGVREVVESLRAAVAPDADAGPVGRSAKVLFVGDGAKAHKQVILENAGDTFALGPEWCVGPRPAVIAAMGKLAVSSGRARNAFEVEPFYLGRSSAETARRGAVSCGGRA